MGIAEIAKGKLKAVAGKMTGKDSLQAEGAAQADKGAEQLKQAQAQDAAQVHEKKAEAAHRKQKAAEDAD